MHKRWERFILMTCFGLYGYTTDRWGGEGVYPLEYQKRKALHISVSVNAYSALFWWHVLYESEGVRGILKFKISTRVSKGITREKHFTLVFTCICLEWFAKLMLLSGARPGLAICNLVWWWPTVKVEFFANTLIFALFAQNFKNTKIKMRQYISFSAEVYGSKFSTVKIKTDQFISNWWIANI